MKKLGYLAVTLACLSFAALSYAQTTSASRAVNAAQASAQGSWELGPVVQAGVGIGDRSSFRFFTAGAHAGKVLTPPLLSGLLRGQFEYAGEILPFWQAYTPAPHLQSVKYVFQGQTGTARVPYGGGTYTGASITPIILRWNLNPSGRWLPWVQGAGGLIWTNHKFPPDILVPHGDPGGTSVFNFTPQFGIGFHYFIRPQRSITFAANAVHISSASLGDRNPGVNASVQFQIGYSWWK